MRSWVYRNRRHLERIYGAPGRDRPLTEPAGPRSTAPAGAQAGPRAGARILRLVVYPLIPLPRREVRSAG